MDCAGGESFCADRLGKDANAAWGVNNHVLSLGSLDLPLIDKPRLRRPAARPQPQFQHMAQRPVQVRPQSQFHSAPPPLDEWVGRSELLEGLKRDYADPQRRVTGLIGFGGEEKSSLARGRWIAQSHGRAGLVPAWMRATTRVRPCSRRFLICARRLATPWTAATASVGNLGQALPPNHHRQPPFSPAEL
jgi:hypothetical protein